jgi:hypothetical protein
MLVLFVSTTYTHPHAQDMLKPQAVRDLGYLAKVQVVVKRKKLLQIVHFLSQVFLIICTWDEPLTVPRSSHITSAKVT